MAIFGNAKARAFGCLAAALLATGLSGCNIIITKTPLFEPGGPGSPSLKEGIWVSDAKPDCKFDETRPAETWPHCSGWGLVQANESLTYRADTKVWARDAQMVFSAGDPFVMQVHPLSAKDDIGFTYLGLEPLKLDSVGKITAAEFWYALCGPPPPSKEQPKSNDLNAVIKADEDNARTLSPLPGVTMDPSGGTDCTTDDPNVVRASAKASRAWRDGAPDRAHWVRTGYH